MYTQRKADFATTTKPRYSNDIVAVVVFKDSEGFWRLRFQLFRLLHLFYFFQPHEKIEVYIGLERIMVLILDGNSLNVAHA